jgi:hypothetical protein
VEKQQVRPRRLGQLESLLISSAGNGGDPGIRGNGVEVHEGAVDRNGSGESAEGLFHTGPILLVVLAQMRGVIHPLQFGPHAVARRLQKIALQGLEGNGYVEIGEGPHVSDSFIGAGPGEEGHSIPPPR